MISQFSFEADPGVGYTCAVSGIPTLDRLLGSWSRRPAAELASGFRSAEPFPHVTLDGFLEESFAQRLTSEFPPFERGQSGNELGRAGGKSVIPRIAELGGAYAQFDTLMQSAEFRSSIGAVTGFPQLLYDPDYAGGGTHENRNGQELDLHIDFNYHPRTGWHRRLNLILYLNQDWDESWGGSLELAKDPWNLESGFVSVTPEWNRAVLFETSERSWHGFQAVAAPDDRSRKSIAVYFYTSDRDAAPGESGSKRPAAHATVYVPRPLPPHILRDGYTLTADDAYRIEKAIARRDQQIRFLYERELGFSRQLASPAYRAFRAIVKPLRKLLGRG